MWEHSVLDAVVVVVVDDVGPTVAAGNRNTLANFAWHAGSIAAQPSYIFKKGKFILIYKNKRMASKCAIDIVL